MDIFLTAVYWTAGIAVAYLTISLLFCLGLLIGIASIIAVASALRGRR